MEKTDEMVRQIVLNHLEKGLAAAQTLQDLAPLAIHDENQAVRWHEALEAVGKADVGLRIAARHFADAFSSALQTRVEIEDARALLEEKQQQGHSEHNR